jgi:hypothetical protein
MDAIEPRRPSPLEDKNSRLKRLVAELGLGREMLQGFRFCTHFPSSVWPTIWSESPLPSLRAEDLNKITEL